MMDLENTIMTYVPGKRKVTPSGWISFNAVCCHHNDQRPDDRGRGGLRCDDGAISYHCFNCNFTAHWRPGRSLNYKFKKLLLWLGMPEEDIRRLTLAALAQVDVTLQPREKAKELPRFEPKDPCPGRPIMSWLADGHVTEEDFTDLESAINYLDSRGLGSKLDRFNWSSAEDERSRVWVPYTWNGRVVGYSGRAYGSAPKRAKYLSSYPAGMVWGYDQQRPDAKICLVVEGLLDAIACDGLAICSNEVSETQAQIIDSLDRQVIVVPDRDEPGRKMVDAALNYGWDVAFPEWELGVKDVADANLRYGQLFTLRSILDTTEHSALKIKLMSRRWFS
jgi:hypothetical protein